MKIAKQLCVIYNPLWSKWINDSTVLVSKAVCWAWHNSSQSFTLKKFCPRYCWLQRTVARMLKLNSKRGKNYHSTYTTPMAKTYTAGHSEQSLLFSFICVTSIRLKLRFLNMQEIYMLPTSQIWNLWSYLFSSLLNNIGLSWCLAEF